VIGEHGTSQVFLWSSARIARITINRLIEERGETADMVRKEIENSVRYANITIIEGNDASQFGIGIVAARVAEMVLRDERAVIPNPRWRGPELRTGDVIRGAASAGAWCCQFKEIVRPKLSVMSRRHARSSAMRITKSFALADNCAVPPQRLHLRQSHRRRVSRSLIGYP
jgi:malate/lactate dehydrogenase